MATERRSYRAAETNLLWAASGNRCAYPHCTLRLVEESGGRWLTQGEIAHIHAVSPGGPRYDASLDAEAVNAYGNLLLLCRPHHRLIDADPITYPAGVLLGWKEAIASLHMPALLASGLHAGLLNPPRVYAERLRRPDAIRRCQGLLQDSSALAITGMAGAGKSVLAADVMGEVQDVTFRWWIRGASREVFLDDLAAVGVFLGIPEYLTERLRAAEWVSAALAVRQDWLMVIDEPCDLGLLAYVPRQAGRLLITTQAATLDGMPTFSVPPFDDEEARWILLRGQPEGEHVLALDGLVQSCHGLPIALAQVRAFKVKTGVTWGRLKSLLERQAPSFFEQSLNGSGSAFGSIMRLTWERLPPDARDLLATLSALGPGRFPLTGAINGADLPFECFNDDLRLESAIGDLRAFSLIDRQDTHVSIHGLVRGAVRRALDSQPEVALLVGIALLSTLLPTWTGRADSWRLMEDLEAHVLSVADEIEGKAGMEYVLAFAGILNKLAPYLSARGRLPEAIALLERAAGVLDSHAEAQEAPSEYLAMRGSITHNLANALGESGDDDRAEGLMRQALSSKTAGGAGVASIAVAHSGLGDILERLGRRGEAGRAAYTQAFELYKALDDRRGSADALKDLGRLAYSRGDVAQGIALTTDALERTHGDAVDWDIRLHALSELAHMIEEEDLPEAVRMAREGEALVRTFAPSSIDHARLLILRARLLSELLPSATVGRLALRASDMMSGVVSANGSSVAIERLYGNAGLVLAREGSTRLRLAGVELLKRSALALTSLSGPHDEDALHGKRMLVQGMLLCGDVPQATGLVHEVMADADGSQELGWFERMASMLDLVRAATTDHAAQVVGRGFFDMQVLFAFAAQMYLDAQD